MGVVWAVAVSLGWRGRGVGGRRRRARVGSFDSRWTWAGEKKEGEKEWRRGRDGGIVGGIKESRGGEEKK